MTPYEIMLSESQERMLIIAKRGREDVVRQVFDKWDVPCAEIGRVTSDGIMRVRNNGTIAAEIPAKALADEAPLYSREAKSPAVTASLRDARASLTERRLQEIDVRTNLFGSFFATRRLRPKIGCIGSTITQFARERW